MNLYKPDDSALRGAWQSAVDKLINYEHELEHEDYLDKVIEELTQCSQAKLTMSKDAPTRLQQTAPISSQSESSFLLLSESDVQTLVHVDNLNS